MGSAFELRTRSENVTFYFVYSPDLEKKGRLLAKKCTEKLSKMLLNAVKETEAYENEWQNEGEFSDGWGRNRRMSKGRKKKMMVMAQKKKKKM